MSFTTGQQPCEHFKPHDQDFPGSGNVHSCMWPFEGDGPRCEESHGGLVSWCENCGKDHHSNGYETCAKSQPKAEGGAGGAR